MKKYFLSLLFLSLSVIALTAQTQYNRYGMKLVQTDGVYSVADAQKYTVDLNSLPEVLVPYKPVLECIDDEAVKTVVAEDVVYKTSKFGQELHMVVYKALKPKAPVVFFFHGGGWKGGSYKTSAAFFKTLAGKYGVTVVSMQYTFATVKGAKMEDAVKDCYDGVEFVAQNADNFGVDASRMGFFGSSAGAHLSAMCSLHFPQTVAYVGYYGSYDLGLSMSIYVPESDVKKHAIYDDFLCGWDPAYIDSQAPAKLLRNPSALANKKLDFKSVLFVGTQDITISPENAFIYEKVMREAGLKDVEICCYENITHYMFNSSFANEIYQKTIDFFTKTLTPGFKTVDVAEFAKVIENGGVTVLDVRTYEEHKEGHIPGTDFNFDVLEDSFSKLAAGALPKDKPVALYCRSGNRSKKAARILVEKGYEVVELGTGFKGWAQAGKEVKK